MNTHLHQGRFLGFVQVRVGAQVFALPVQAVHFERDQSGGGPAGGFFTEKGAEEGADQFGILVDEDATPGDVRAQIERGSAEAARHIGQRYLN
jgi:hypothetical protein